MSSDATTESAVSPRKLAANRRNSEKSTGPRTAEGKAICSRNGGVKHGIFAKAILLPGEDADARKELGKALLADINPQSVMELKLVELLIDDHWRLQRLRAAEKELYETDPAQLLLKQTRPTERPRLGYQFDMKSENDEEDSIDNETNRQRWRRWTRNNQQLVPLLEEGRNLDWMQAGLTGSLIKARLMSELAPDDPACALPIDPPPPPKNENAAAKTMAILLASDNPALERLHRYEHRIRHSMIRTMNEIRKLREDRQKDQASAGLSDVACDAIAALEVDADEAPSTAESSTASEHLENAEPPEANPPEASAGPGIAEGDATSEPPETNLTTSSPIVMEPQPQTFPLRPTG